MTIETFLDKSTLTLRDANIPSARLDCLVLLEDTLKRDRAHILAHPEDEIPKSTEVALNKKIVQRAKNIPLAYIRGIAPFYGREFTVNKNVLVPRPETEVMITTLKNLHLPPHPKIADIGSGSGCLGITAALEVPDSSVDLYDIDASALAVAEINATRHAISAPGYQSDLLKNYHGFYDVLLANLPYVPKDYPVNEAARQEPALAVYSGIEGLDHYRRFWRQVDALPASRKPGFILTEAMSFQHDKLVHLACQAGYRLGLTDGLIQQFQR